jgi:hypothetical protein
MTKKLAGRGRIKAEPCILCEKAIEKEDKTRIIPIEWVRLENEIRYTTPHNFIVHHSCYENSSENTIETAIKQHIIPLL